MSALPYFFNFTEPDGSPWLLGGDWGTMTGPGSWATVDIQGNRGRFLLTQDAKTFGARLWTDSSDAYNVAFTFDLSEIVSMFTVSDTLTDPNFYLWVQLQDAAEGVDFYEIYIDPFTGLSAGIRKHTNGVTGYEGLPYSEYTGEGLVSLTDIDPSQPMYLRIQEFANTRQFKVWQGNEPVAWLITDTTAPTYISTPQRYVDLYGSGNYDASPSMYVDEFEVDVNIDGPWHWESVGSTTHFNFWYDSSLGALAAGDAVQEMAYIEDDLQYHFRWFGNTATWESGPQQIDIRYVSNDHSDFPIPQALAFYEPDTTTIYVNWQEPTPNIEMATLPRERSILVHELVHHFQHLQTFYQRDDPFLEAHAAFLERQFRYDNDAEQLRSGGYAQMVKTWLDSGRPDYVSNDDYGGLDVEYNKAVGCALLFLNYLKYQKGYSATAITEANALIATGTPHATWTGLTGDILSDPFVPFIQQLDLAFPPGTPVDTSGWTDIANPYPLGTSNVIHSKSGPGGAFGGAVIGAAHGAAIQALLRSLRP